MKSYSIAPASQSVDEVSRSPAYATLFAQ